MLLATLRSVIIGIAVVACSAGDNTVDPSDLELRDLLGVSPETASAWSAAQRAAALRVLVAGLHADDQPARHARDREASGAGLDAAEPMRSDPGATADDRVVRWLGIDDAQRAADGVGSLGLVRITLDAGGSQLTALSTPATAAALTAPFGRRAPTRDTRPRTAASPELWLSERWDTEPGLAQLTGRGLGILSALAIDAEHPGGPLIVVPAPRLAVIAAYLRPHDAAARPRLAVNPVLLAALEPDPDQAGAEPTLRSASSPGPAAPLAGTSASTGGNPYSFYGSFEECAAAQRARCEACLSASTCTAITSTPDGNAECTMLAASSGRGYFLLCINLALAITSVDGCAGDAAPGCARDPDAADSLATLDNNAGFLDDSTCADALDTCLAQIYGAPNEPFPELDGGTLPADPPRSTVVNCGNACETKNSSCNASPSIDCSGPSCNDSQSCDSACSSSHDQSGCGGDCSACSSSGSGGGGGGGGCSGGSSSSGGGCGSGSGAGCGGSGGNCGSGSSSGGSCGGSSCGSGSGGSGGSCGGNSCGSGNGGSCGGSGGSCGGSGGSKCSAVPSDPGAGVTLAVGLMWGLLPVPLAALTRRRARRSRSARIMQPTRTTVSPPGTKVDAGGTGEPAP